jgi:hypothetical protein
MFSAVASARVAVLAAAAVCALAFASSASAATSHHVLRVGRPDHVDPLAPFGGINNDTVASTNWSGYAVQGAGKFTDARGSWKEPTATCNSSSAQYASFWVGIDGYSSNSVEQLGTDSDCTGRGRAAYYAWYEMYPANSISLSTTKYPVKPGDTLTAEVSVNGSSFTLTLKSSEGWTFSTTQSGSGLAQSSAEWIAESPELCGRSCTLAQLADFGTVNFTGAEAALNAGADQPLSASEFTADSGPHDIIAEANRRTVKAVPSALTTGGTAFSIAWQHS